MASATSRLVFLLPFTCRAPVAQRLHADKPALDHFPEVRATLDWLRGRPLMENVVRVLSTLALMGAVRSLAGRYEAERGVRVDADFAPTIGLLERLRAGESADVVILTKRRSRISRRKETWPPGVASTWRVPLSASP
jgi:ABC-type molybdate transport system substrate-binding protein